MSEAELLAWCVPVALAAISGMFFALSVPGITSWRVAYALAAAAYAVTIPPAPDGWVLPKAIFEDALFLAAVAAFTRGVSQRFNRPTHDGPVAAAVCLALACAGVALAVRGSVALEVTAVQVPCAGFSVLSAWHMRDRLERPVNRALFGAAILFAGSLVLQSAALFVFPDPMLTVATWRESWWAFAFQLSGFGFGVAFAFIALIALGIDVVDGFRISSETDALSGLLNRRGFEKRFRAVGSAGMAGGLILADLDHFKNVNDRHGHEAGDMAIVGVGALIASICGPDGFGARLGGEEFVLFLPRERGDPGPLAEFVRQALVRVEWPGRLAGTRITASLGAVVVATGESFESAFRRADRMLYAAKNAGRDRVVTVQPALTAQVA